MAVTLNIIKEELKNLRTEDHLRADANPVFNMCLPMPEDPGELRKDCLYVGGLSLALKVRRNRGDVVIVCLRDRLADGIEDGDATDNLIIINENISLNMLLSRIQNRFFAIMDWEQRLRVALLKGGSMQDLVDLCPPFLENHIQITDASFMKLAQSSRIECDDPICLALKQHGYHPEETVNKFRAHNLFDVWARMNDVYYDGETTVARYPTVHKIFKFHGIYYAHVVMTCNVSPVNQAMMDYFRIFISALSLCVERDWENKFSCIHPYDSVLQDLLEGRVKDSTQIEKRVSYAGLPMSGAFHIVRIVRDEAHNISLGTMMKDFSERFPRFKFINYQNSITAFVFASLRSSEDTEDMLEGLPEYLEKHNCFCGVSTQFYKLTEAQHYLRQAALALKYGLHMHQHALEDDMGVGRGKGGRIFYFDDCFSLCFFGNEEDLPGLWQHSLYFQKLKELHENDLQRGSNDLKLLFTYLRHERRITVTAGILNMHRNSLIYRINRIEEFLGVDLNDDRTRLMLLFASVPAAFYGFDQDVQMP